MPSPSQAWVALRTAMLDDRPACAGDDRFIADDSEVAPLIAICKSCPLLAPCSTLARTGNLVPIYGVVGGLIRRGTRSTGLMNAKAMERRINA